MKTYFDRLINALRHFSGKQVQCLRGVAVIAVGSADIAIRGVSECPSRQPACPVVSPTVPCYACPAFTPVRDGRVHAQVLTLLRQTVRSFDDASREHRVTPRRAPVVEG